MASTSSLEFRGCTVSCCLTGCCCSCGDCADRSSGFTASGVGGGLCAKALAIVNPPSSAALVVRPRIPCIASTSSQCVPAMRCARRGKVPSLLGSAIGGCLQRTIKLIALNILTTESSHFLCDPERTAALERGAHINPLHLSASHVLSQRFCAS